MDSINQLPIVYRIAFFLGARIEAFYENKWQTVTNMILSSRTKIRVHPDDTMLLEQAKKTVMENQYEFDYDGYSYFVPKLALKPGNIIIIYYGLGNFIKVNKDLSFTTMDSEEFKEYLKENKNKSHHTARSYETIFGYPEQISGKTISEE